MDAKRFIEGLNTLGADFFTGVPDSLLSPFCNAIMHECGVCPDKHVVAANEGAAAALAAGYYLATGKPAVIYMQNSGIGNAVNPICSLLNDQVYAIPAIFVVGWRGEPGVKDEPQHVYQGEVTLRMLDCLGIAYAVVSKESTEEDFRRMLEGFAPILQSGRQVAFVVRKGALETSVKMQYTSDAPMTREYIVKTVADHAGQRDVFVCTTGKLSREMFEIRENSGQGHEKDFLTVGSMGHSVMIAMGIAAQKPERKVYCLDGDGAVLMHMGSLAVAGMHKVANLVHLVVNNGAHETVGGLPTVAGGLKLSAVAQALGYCQVYRAQNEAELTHALESAAKDEGPVFIEAVSDLFSRDDLGRPTTTPRQNKAALMDYLEGK
ncbi:MAG: phosphonopyruvate decarboxylase [Christensenellales bacterium]